MATEYRVEVPAGTRAARRRRRSAERRRVELLHAPAAPRRAPSRGRTGAARRPPVRRLRSARRRRGGARHPARARGRRERAAEARHPRRRSRPTRTVARLAGQAEEGRWLAFRTDARRCRADAAVTVTVGPGTPSAEGPRVTEEPQEWGFRTYGPFRVRGARVRLGRAAVLAPGPVADPLHQPGRREDVPRGHGPRGSPGARPEGRGAAATPSSSAARRRGRTSYRVTPVARDPRHLRPGPRRGARARLRRRPGRRGALRPRGRLRRPRPRGRRAVRRSTPSTTRRCACEAWAVGPEDWAAWHAYRQRRLAQRRRRSPRAAASSTPPCGPRARADELVETRLDLTPALDGRTRSGHPRRPAGEADEGRPRPGGPGLGAGDAHRPRRLRGRPRPSSPGRRRSATAAPSTDVEVSLVPGATVAHRTRRDSPAWPSARRRLRSSWRGTGGTSPSSPPTTSWWNERLGLGADASGATALRFYVFDDRQHVPARRGGARQGLAAPRRGRPRGRRRPAPGRGARARAGP